MKCKALVNPIVFVVMAHTHIKQSILPYLISHVHPQFANRINTELFYGENTCSEYTVGM
jgi:hypothetical protein